ncbi:MAG: ankyrin repeat domain-containing protein [Candidatus Sericytochromatia bacterium]
MEQSRLFDAFKADQVAVLAAALEAGPLPLVRGVEPLRHAAFFGAVQILRLLLTQLAEPASEIARLELLMIAKNGKTCEVLLAMGADPQAINANGMTALHLAVANQRSSAVKALIKAGANLEAISGLGETPLHAALRLELADLALLLLKAGANPLSPNRQGFSPLRQALTAQNEARRQKMVAALLKQGVPVDAGASAMFQRGWQTPEIAEHLRQPEPDLEIWW